jgi:hypothetical protein
VEEKFQFVDNARRQKTKKKSEEGKDNKYHHYLNTLLAAWII